jgi:diguanylate cyclase (GGDEF)-like protein
VVAEAEKLADVLRYVPGACIVVDDGIVRGANDEAVQTMGIPRGRLVGSPLPELAVSEMQVGLTAFIDHATEHVTHHSFRLASGLSPIELSSRRISDSLVICGVRRMETEHQMSALAGGELTHDQVTGLPNRYHVLEQLHHRLGTKSPQSLAIIAIWIDDLPNLRDERGPRVVERVSRQVGERIQARLRGPDLLGRFDDEAFLALLTTESNLEQLNEIADRLRNEVAFPVEFDGSLVSFTASVLVGSIGTSRPTLERVQSRLEAVGRMASASGGNRTEIVTF